MEASLIAQLVRIHLQCRRHQFDSWVRKICWKKVGYPLLVFLGFPCGSAGKESACNEGDLGLIPGLGRSPGEGNSYPLQYSGLEYFMDCRVHGVTKSWTGLRDFFITSSNAGETGSIPGHGAKLSSTTGQLSPQPKLLSPCTQEPICCNERRPTRDNKEPTHENEDPVQPKIKGLPTCR